MSLISNVKIMGLVSCMTKFKFHSRLLNDIIQKMRSLTIKMDEDLQSEVRIDQFLSWDIW